MIWSFQKKLLIFGSSFCFWPWLYRRKSQQRQQLLHFSALIDFAILQRVQDITLHVTLQEFIHTILCWFELNQGMKSSNWLLFSNKVGKCVAFRPPAGIVWKLDGLTSHPEVCHHCPRAFHIRYIQIRCVYNFIWISPASRHRPDRWGSRYSAMRYFLVKGAHSGSEQRFGWLWVIEAKTRGCLCVFPFLSWWYKVQNALRCWWFHWDLECWLPESRFAECGLVDLPPVLNRRKHQCKV